MFVLARKRADGKHQKQSESDPKKKLHEQAVILTFLAEDSQQKNSNYKTQTFFAQSHEFFMPKHLNQYSKPIKTNKNVSGKPETRLSS